MPAELNGHADGVDTSALKRALRATVAGEVRFDAGARAMYANDFSVYRAVPIGVVIPRTADYVIAGVAACRQYGAPVLPRGCGTAPSGQTTNVAVVFDYSKYFNEIVELDPENKRARVQPGVICDQLRNAAERHNLTYGPDPATHEYCTFGGMLGNNSCGTHSLMAGKTSDNVLELELLLYDGTRLTVGPTPDEQLTEIIATGDRKAHIYGALKGPSRLPGRRLQLEGVCVSRTGAPPRADGAAVAPRGWSTSRLSSTPRPLPIVGAKCIRAACPQE